MKRTLFAVTLVASHFANAEQLDFKGILLVDQLGSTVQEGISDFGGLKIRGLQIPGKLEELQKKIEPLFIRQPITDGKLNLIQRQIIQYYKEKGRPLVAVEIPTQDVSNGMVQMVVKESHLGEVVCYGNLWFADSLLKSYIRTRPGEPIDASQLQNDVSWMNQSPFHKTDVVYTPGAKPYTTDIELMTKDRLPWRLYGGGDNTGIDTTGNARWFGGFDWGNALFLDQKLTFQGTTSTDLRRFRSWTIHYTAPLPWKDRLVVYGGYSKVLPDDIESFVPKGKSAQGSLRYECSILPLYDAINHQVILGFDLKNSNNSFEFSTGESTAVFGRMLNVFQFVGGYNFGWELSKHTLSFQALLFWSPGHIFAHQGPGNFHSQRSHAKSAYVYERISFSWTYQLPSNFSLFTQVRTQVSDENLVPSEEFGLGGYDTVRGYDERELNVDEGVCFNLELRMPSFSITKLFGRRRPLDELTLLLFFDYGAGGSIRDVVGALNEGHLIGIGPGIRFRMAQNLSARFDFGFPLHKLISTSHRVEKTHLGIILSY